MFEDDPIVTLDINKIKEIPLKNNFTFLKINNAYHIHIGFLVSISKWNIDKYKIFLDNINNKIDNEYEFRIEYEPALWIYKDGYIYFTIYDYGQWYNSVKIKVDDIVLERLTNLVTIDNINVYE
jgi:hypothetical protein